MYSISLKFIILTFFTSVYARYSPDWDSLDTRPLPEWYDRSKIGIFIHWGVWTVPAVGFPEAYYLWNYIGTNQSDAVNYMKKNYSPGVKYPNFASDFKAELYEPEKWVDLFNSSGAKYIVLVSKHHEGYSLWPSAQSWNWNSMDVGPNRDLFGDLMNAIRKKTDIKMGAYYSLFEFYNSLYLSDKASNFTKNEYIENKMIPQLKDLVNTYKPDIIWSDGDWDTDSNYFQSKEFLAWLYNDSPSAETVIVNDRWGSDAACKHGDFDTCTDRFNPRILQSKKFENIMSLDLVSWGYRNNYDLSDVILIEDLIEEIVTTVSCGGNININIGATSHGTFAPIYEERLRQMGKWLDINGEAIYNTKPWMLQNDTFNDNQIWYTSRVSNANQIELYAISLKWPTLLKTFNKLDFTIKLNASAECAKISFVSFLGFENSQLLDFRHVKEMLKDGLNFHCIQDEPYSVLVDLEGVNSLDSSSNYAWTFKFYLTV